MIWLLFIPIFLFSSVLSDLKEKSFDYQLQKSIKDSDKLQNSWINPIFVKYSYNKNNKLSSKQTTKTLSIVVNQPIFKSGGIYYSILYAKNLKDKSILEIEKNKNNLIKTALQNGYNLKIINLQIQKQKLLLDNALIDLKVKKNEFLKGLIDSSFVENAIINKNNVLFNIEDLKSQRQTIILNLKNLIGNKQLTLPTFKLIDKNKFIDNNYDLLTMKKDIAVKNYLKKMKISDNLLTLNLNLSYNNQKTNYSPETLLLQNDDTTYYSVGFEVKLPLSINALRDIESAKIDYLNSKIKYKDKLQEIQNLYQKSLNNIKLIDNQIKIKQQNLKMYDSLLASIKDNLKAGINTKDDYKRMFNSKNITLIDIKILKLKKQIELLNLYYMIKR